MSNKVLDRMTYPINDLSILGLNLNNVSERVPDSKLSSLHTLSLDQ